MNVSERRLTAFGSDIRRQVRQLRRIQVVDGYQATFDARLDVIWRSVDELLADALVARNTKGTRVKEEA